MMGKLTIDTSNITELDLIEGCFNYAHSSLEWEPYIGFYAMAERWHIDKVIYYINLIRESLKDD